MAANRPDHTAESLLPASEPVRFLPQPGDDALGEIAAAYALPADELLLEAHRRMVIGRRFDTQATAFARQGRLAVYPSSRGQDACQIAAGLALRDSDWLFPTYRDSMALIARGLDPIEVLTLLRGDWHCGYDPAAVRVAPQCTPLATQALHATGLAEAMRRDETDGVALVLIGDGATSEGDFHEALNFAAVFRSPVVFLVQNNGYAISVPLARQNVAPSLAHKGIGYGVRSEQVDGNDLPATLSVLMAAVEYARRGNGPMLIEAHTYRVEAHTNADDATRYRDADEVERWRAVDPLDRLTVFLQERGVLTEELAAAAQTEAESYAAALRARIDADPGVTPLEIFAHVYAEPTPQLREQRAALAAELAAGSETEGYR